MEHIIRKAVMVAVTEWLEANYHHGDKPELAIAEIGKYLLRHADSLAKDCNPIVRRG